MSTPRVEAYWNLHEQCLSYRATTKGARVKHAHTLLLNECTLDVQPAGKARVRAEGRKNVHAFVRGMAAWVRPTIEDDEGDLTVSNMERQDYMRITYNPYKHDSFVVAATGEPIYRARQVALIGKDLFVTRHYPGDFGNGA